MTEKEIEQVKDMWSQGYSAVQISRVLPYKEYLALAEIRSLKKQGVLPPRNVQKIMAERVFKEYEETKDIGEIADRLGISKRYIEKIFYYHDDIRKDERQEGEVLIDVLSAYKILWLFKENNQEDQNKVVSDK
jgi:DNA-binding CsgD family transcriptional regulator